MKEQNEAETVDSVENVAKEGSEAASKKESDAAQSRQRSTIPFPYNDLGDAIEFGQAILDHVGHGDCDDDQLAAWVNQSPKSSGFRTQLSASRMFGVIESDGSGKHKLTQLGLQIVDPGQAREAKVTAFLNVPLYKAAYEKYKSTVIPPNAALELDFVRLGVAEKQRDRARAIFNRSAEQAGFFEHGKNRLVQPGIIAKQIPTSIVQEPKDENGGGSGSNGGSGSDAAPFDLDPLLLALLQKIPSKNEGWSAAKRVRWFRTFAMNVSQVYDDDESPVELEIHVGKGD